MSESQSKQDGLFEGKVLAKLDTIAEQYQATGKSIDALSARLDAVTERCMIRGELIAQARSRGTIALWLIGILVVPLILTIGGIAGYRLTQSANGATPISHTEK